MRRCFSKVFLALLLTIALTHSSAYADEFRAFWVDAWGAGFLNQSQVDKLLGVVGSATQKGDIRNANCNAVIVQVRRRADVCYPSAMGEPYFSGLSPSDFNALQAMINAAHDTTGGKQRIEVHAWIVVFACGTSSYTAPLFYAHNDPSDPDNYWVTLTDEGNYTEDKALDPGHPKCEEYLVNVCMDLVNNFDIDGLHFDYIRFTANDQGYNPTSVARFNQRYGRSGQPAYDDELWKQWRRDQITNFVRKVYAKIQATKPHVKLSGAFVTWNPSPTASTRAAFQATRPYYDVYSDWDAWLQEGIIDMAVPMTYYNYSTYPNDYVRWMNFEKDRKANRHMIVGPGIYLNSLSNAILELKMTRDPSPAGNRAQGFCGYSYRVPYSGGTWANFAPTFVSEVCPTPDVIPPMPWKTNPTKGHISGTVTYAGSGQWADGAIVTITGPENRSMYCDGTGFYAFIDVTPGLYTVTASKTGYPSAQRQVQVAIGQVTGNMYVTDLVLGATNQPVITNVGASSITNNSATISWNTDQPADSRVEYGTTTNYGQTTPLDSNLVTNHSVVISGLSQKTTYHYRVHSANANGSSTSGDYTFTTSGPPVISNPQAVNVTSTSATIVWTTDVPADSRVNYGTTSSYGSQVTDSTPLTSHSISLAGLNPNTTYHYQCVSTNAYGSAQTADLTFTTADTTAEIVIDNTDAGWSNTSPNGNTWNVGSSSVVPKIGTNYLYASGDGSLTESLSTRKCRWTPNLPTSGYYDVYVYYQIGSNRNEAAPYKVYYYGGSLTSIQNQYSTTPNQGGWFKIGSALPFLVGTSGYVELSTLSLDTKYVSADAAKWVLVSAADFTPPTMSFVTDEQYTTSTNSLQAWWSGSDPESGIQRYEYAIGTTPGATNVKGWTNAGTATSVTISDLNLSVGTKYYISVRAVNGYGLTSSPVTSSGVTVARAVATIAQAKGYADGEVIGLPPLSVSAAFPGVFYIEESNRTSGIRVESTVPVSVNQQVQVYGVLGTYNSCERRLTNCKVVTGSMGPAIRPLGIITRSANTNALNLYTPGFTGGIGLHNTGLLVRLAGKVTAVVSDGFYLDDGCKLSDGSGTLGIKVWTGASGSATVGSMVKVTGIISSRIGTSGKLCPQILALDVASP